MSNTKNILFDLDGTITEPKEGIINSILYSIEKLNLSEENPEELTSFIGPPLLDSYKNRYNLNHEDATAAVDCYREYYSDRGLYECSMFPNIPQLISSLKEAGHNLFVATSKPTYFAEKLLEHYRLDHHFTEIVGANMDNTRADKTSIISYILKTHNLNPNNTLMIGDTKFDLIGAKNNNVEVIAVTYGHGNTSELVELEPNHIAANALELASLLTVEF